jgi:hypothetical protein
VSISGSGISIDGGISLAPGGGAAATVSSLIAAQKPKKFFKMWEEVGFNISDHGAEPSESMTAQGTTTFESETPMLDDPTQTAIEFNGTTGYILSTDAGDVVDFATGTFFCFFKFQTLTNGMLYSQGNAGGATKGQIFHFDSSGTSQIWIRMRIDGGANFMASILEPVGAANIALNVWHMIAYRQPGLGAGPNAFWDGTFYTTADAELTNSIGGTEDLDAWFAETTAATDPADRASIAASVDTVPTSFIDGLEFAVVIDDVVWSDANISAVWDAALANGLNA